MSAGYSSDDDAFNFGAIARARDHSRTSESANSLKTATKAMQGETAHASESSKGFLNEHISQIAIAALVAAGAAAAYLLKRKSSKKQAGKKDSPSATEPKEAASLPKRADTKKLAMRRKRSE